MVVVLGCIGICLRLEGSAGNWKQRKGKDGLVCCLVAWLGKCRERREGTNCGRSIYIDRDMEPWCSKEKIGLRLVSCVTAGSDRLLLARNRSAGHQRRRDS
jgi:hypothetical protein